MNKEKSIAHDVHKKPFSKVLLSRLVSFKFRYISVMKGVLFQQKTKKTWTAFMKNICVQWMCPTDSSHWDDDLYFKLAVYEHLDYCLWTLFHTVCAILKFKKVKK